jgi:HTH-type transcriptional regulator/antitoxin HigA
MNLDKIETHIQTEEEYENALQEIEQLWEAPYGSPEGDKLDILATLVAAYEEKHHQINPTRRLK